MSLITINSRGIDFNVKIVRNGENYGLNNVLTHDKDDPLVEFYDSRYPHTEHGQFVSRYYASTLLERVRDVGLDLYGGNNDWKIEASEMKTVVDWLKKETTNNINTTKKMKP